MWKLWNVGSLYKLQYPDPSHYCLSLSAILLSASTLFGYCIWPNQHGWKTDFLRTETKILLYSIVLFNRNIQRTFNTSAKSVNTKIALQHWSWYLAFQLCIILTCKEDDLIVSPVSYAYCDSFLAFWTYCLVDWIFAKPGFNIIIWKVSIF